MRSYGLLTAATQWLIAKLFSHPVWHSVRYKDDPVFGPAAAAVLFARVLLYHPPQHTTSTELIVNAASAFAFVYAYGSLGRALFLFLFAFCVDAGCQTSWHRFTPVHICFYFLN